MRCNSQADALFNNQILSKLPSLLPRIGEAEPSADNDRRQGVALDLCGFLGPLMRTWEFLKIQGLEHRPQIVRIQLQGHPPKGPPIY